MVRRHRGKRAGWVVVLDPTSLVQNRQMLVLSVSRLRGVPRGALRGGARAPGTGRRLRPPLLPSVVEFACLLHRGTANGIP